MGVSFGGAKPTGKPQLSKNLMDGTCCSWICANGQKKGNQKKKIKKDRKSEDREKDRGECQTVSLRRKGWSDINEDPL